MAAAPLRSVLRLLRRAAGVEAGPTDRQLVERYVGDRDEGAFELLVWRHGPMVLGVCRRLLGHAQDAEDAFQATFLTLVRKAGSIGSRESIGAWLHRVAFRVALRARDRAERQPRPANEGLEVPAPQEVPPVVWRELRAVLDEEVGRLPERERAPVVLCYLEGKTNAEAARQLGCPLGTVAIRLKRARDRLRGRLLRRGLALSAGALAVLAKKASASLAPAELVQATLRAAVGWAQGKAGTAAVSARVVVLTEGVLRAMFLNKLKGVAAAVLAAGVMIVGAGAILWRGAAPAGAGSAPPPRAASADDPSAADVCSERDGVLLVVGTEVLPGEKVPPGLRIKVKTDGVVKTYRRLRVGDVVNEGQLLARVDDRLARDEVAIKQAMVDGAEAAYRSALRTKEAAEKRIDELRQVKAKVPLAADVLHEAERARDRCIEEEKVQAVKVRQARAELDAARTILAMHEIRSPFHGVIRAIFRRRGEAVRALEPVLKVRAEGREANLLAAGAERIDVPSEQEGKLVVVGRELTPKEEKQVADLRGKGKPLPRGYIEVRVGLLAIEVQPGEKVPPDQLVRLKGAAKQYRRRKPGDELLPGQVVLVRQKKMFRKLSVGDKVEEGQVLALVNPALALDELAVRVATLEAAEADRLAAGKTKDEAHKLYLAKERTHREVRGAISQDELRGAKLSWERYIQEELAKAAAVRKAQREVRRALTMLRMHEVRSSGAGVVTRIYRRSGEAVKRLDPVVQIEEK